MQSVKSFTLSKSSIFLLFFWWSTISKFITWSQSQSSWHSWAQEMSLLRELLNAFFLIPMILISIVTLIKREGILRWYHVVAVIQFHLTDFTSSDFDSDFDFQLDSWTALDIPGLPYEKRLRIGEKIFIDFHMKSPLVHLFVANAH